MMRDGQACAMVHCSDLNMCRSVKLTNKCPFYVHFFAVSWIYPFSGALWIRIPNKDPDPHMYIEYRNIEYRIK